MSRSRPLRLQLAVTGLAVSLALWFSLSGPAEGAAGGTSPCPGANADVSGLTVPQVRAILICVVNYERTAHGWPAFVVDDRLQRAAQTHVDDMAARGYFDHYSPEGIGPEERIEAEGYEWYSQRESLVAESRTVVGVIYLLMGSRESCSYYFDQSVADLGVGFAMSGGPGGVPIWAQNLAAGPSSSMEGYDTAPEVSCPQPLRGDYGTPEGPPGPTDPPGFELSAKGRQQAGEKVKVKAISDEPCRLKLTGTVTPKGEPKGKLKPKSAHLDADARETLKLKLSRKAKQGLAEADTGKAKITGTCTDAAGNPADDTAKTKLR